MFRVSDMPGKKERIKELENLLSVARSANSAGNVSLRDLKAQVKELETKLKVSKGALALRKKEIEQLESDNRGLRKEIDALRVSESNLRLTVQKKTRGTKVDT